MSGDKASSRDSAVIDDDLVEALGFEPLATAGGSVSDGLLADSEVGSNESEHVDPADESELDDQAGPQAVVILGDVTPVDADDPVASDIAAAILGDAIGEPVDSVSEGDVDGETDGLGEPDPVTAVDDTNEPVSPDDVAGDDDVERIGAADASEEGEPVDVIQDGLVQDDAAQDDDSRESALLEDDEGEESASFFGDRSSSETESNSLFDQLLDDLDGSVNVEPGIDSAGAEPELVVAKEGLDPLAIEGAFPEVPALDDSGEAASKLEDRELFTQPIDLDHLDLDALEADSESVFDLDTRVKTDLDPDLDGETTQPSSTVEAALPAGAVPVTRGYRRKRVRAKKTRRVIRHIDPWSVLTFSVLFHLALYTSFLLASVLVWKTLDASGMVKNIEDFIIALGDYETYEINADVLFEAGVIIAGILTVASTILSVLLCVVFNLISDLVGGIRVTVLEEETVRLPSKKSLRKTK